MSVHESTAVPWCPRIPWTPEPADVLVSCTRCQSWQIVLTTSYILQTTFRLPTMPEMMSVLCELLYSIVQGIRTRESVFLHVQHELDAGGGLANIFYLLLAESTDMEAVAMEGQVILDKKSINFQMIFLHPGDYAKEPSREHWRMLAFLFTF